MKSLTMWCAEVTSAQSSSARRSRTTLKGPSSRRKGRAPASRAASRNAASSVPERSVNSRRTKGDAEA